MICGAGHACCRGVVVRPPLSLDKMCRGGVVPRFTDQLVAAKVRSLADGADTCREQMLAKLERQLREYSNKRTRHLQCAGDREP